MKRRLLHLVLLTILPGLAGLIIAGGFLGNYSQKHSGDGDEELLKAEQYLFEMRRNQITGTINPLDVLRAREEAEKLAFKSGKSLGLEWIETGPDNAPGRVRAVIFDNRDPSNKTLIAASVTGGLWKTTNLGATWTSIDPTNQNLNVTCLVQTPDGTIYAGTGEYFCTNLEVYHGGLVGRGIYKSTNSKDFTLIPQTKPQITGQNDTIDWAYINKLSVDKSTGRIYAATNTGLWYSNDGDTWVKANLYYHDTMTYNVSISIDSTFTCQSFTMVGNNITMVNPQLKKVDTTSYVKTSQPRIRTVKILPKINCTDVEVANDGTVAATFGDMVFTASRDNLIFTNHSGTPSNPYLITREIRNFTTTLIAIDTANNSASRTVTFTQTTNFIPDPALGRPSPLANNPGRSNVAFAPSDPSGNIIYAVCTQGGVLYNVYLSENKGETWEIIFPGGSATLNPFTGQTACYNNVFEVFPTNAYKVLLGGTTMWQGQRVQGTTGFFDWGLGPIAGFIPSGHHAYVFQPGTENKLVVATNRGLFYGTPAPGFTAFTNINRNLAITQSYTVASGGLKRKVITGTHGDGMWYISGRGNTVRNGTKFDVNSGGYCAISVINPNAFIHSTSAGAIRRSDDEGRNFSMNFNAPTSQLFLTPLALWEDFQSENSRDSITFKAKRTYYKGEVLLCHSDNAGFGLDAGYPFTYVLEQDSLVAGDSIRIKDIIQAKLFVATHNTVYMTKDAVKFDKDTPWWQIATLTPALGQPTCIAFTKDADVLFIGTRLGTIYRISNIALAYDYARADIRSPYCIIATDIIQYPAFSGRFITSISVDPNNSNHILVTLGNYGNNAYVYRSTNALASPLSGIQFTDITGNLPKMPVYSSLIEMSSSNIAIIGTEFGVYTTSDLGNSTVTWTAENTGVGIIPVMQLKQQTIFKDEFIVYSDDPTTPPLVYPRVDNWGSIYMATFGRGTFRTDRFQIVGIDTPKQNPSANKPFIFVHPNPVSSVAHVKFTLSQDATVIFRLYDLNGKLVIESGPEWMPWGVNEYQINCANLRTGTYLLQVHTGKESMSTKIIVR